MNYYQTSEELEGILNDVIKEDIHIVDGGARNGTREVARLARWAVAYGFEPSPNEYKRIMEGRIKGNLPPYKEIRYLPVALVERTGPATLYISKNPGAASVFKPNDELLKHFHRDHWSELRHVVREETVEGISLRDFFVEQKLTYVDYLKLDTQGNELNILQSSGEFLQNVSVVKTEVETIPMYEKQPLIGDVCSFMASQGFYLIDFKYTDPCRRFLFDSYLPLDGYTLVWGDAYFARNPFDFSAPRKLEQALILAELGYLDLALYLVENVERLDIRDKERIIQFYRKPKPPRSPVKRILQRYLPGNLKHTTIRVMHRRKRKVR